MSPLPALALAAAAAGAAPRAGRFDNTAGVTKYAAWSVVDAAPACEFTPVHVEGRDLSDCAAYRAGDEPVHYICNEDAGRARATDRDLAACRDACAASGSCAVMQWQGERAHGFAASSPGECWLYNACDDSVKYDSAKSHDFCMQIERKDCEAPPGGAQVRVGSVAKDPRNPLMVQDKPWEARLDNGYPNVEYTPGDAGGDWQLWYGGFVTCTHCDTGQGDDRYNAWHYANSTDGIQWQKPELGIFDLAGVPGAPAALKAAGKRNNVLMGDSDGMGMLRDAHEADDAKRYKVVGTGCFDAGGATGCLHGTATSPHGLRWNDATALSWPSPQAWDCHQNMFFDAAAGRYVLTTRDFLRTELTESEGRDIAIVLGAEDGSFGGWGDPVLVEHGTSAHQLYSQVTWRFYNVYLGIVMVFNTKDPETVGTVQCRLSWSHDPTQGWNWVDPGGLTGAEFIPIDGAGSGAFDSNICFAAHLPVPYGDGVRVYYMGGNGPHNGPRNTSLGLATLRADGFAGIAAGDAAANVTTVAIRVTGATLTVTADVLAAGGYVQVGAAAGGAVGWAAAAPVTGNVTDQAVAFAGGATFAAFVGQDVALRVVMRHAMVYTFGFRQ